MPRPTNSSYLGNYNLKRTNQQMDWPQEQVIEYYRCSEDPIYFIKNYVKIISEKGLVNFKLYDFQEEMVENLHNNRFTITVTSRRAGKCVFSATQLKIRNKKTGEIKNISIKEAFNLFCLLNSNSNSAANTKERKTENVLTNKATTIRNKKES
jgi:hypothetical protein